VEDSTLKRWYLSEKPLDAEEVQAVKPQQPRSDEELVADLLELLAVGTAVAAQVMRRSRGPDSPLAHSLGQMAPVMALWKGAASLYQGVELDEETRGVIRWLVGGG